MRLLWPSSIISSSSSSSNGTGEMGQWLMGWVVVAVLFNNWGDPKNRKASEWVSVNWPRLANSFGLVVVMAGLLTERSDNHRHSSFAPCYSHNLCSDISSHFIRLTTTLTRASWERRESHRLSPFSSAQIHVTNREVLQLAISLMIGELPDSHPIRTPSLNYRLALGIFNQRFNPLSVVPRINFSFFVAAEVLLSARTSSNSSGGKRSRPERQLNSGDDRLQPGTVRDW